MARHRAGNSRSGGRASISRTTARRSRSLEAQGLVYPSFESRGEIARLVAERETRAPWPRDPDGAPLYPGDARSLARAERRAAHATGEPYALRLDMAAAMARAGPVTWRETGSGPNGETGIRCGGAESVGRCGAGAQGDADQLSPLGRRR